MERSKKEIFLRNLNLFFEEHRIKIFILALLLLLIFTTILGLSKMESFYRNQMLATIPLQLLSAGLSAAIFVSMHAMFMRGGNMGKMDKKSVEGKQVNVKFSDVIGCEEAKAEAKEVVELLKDRARVQAVGGKIVKGVIFLGPPGTGKTLLAKAIATEAGVPFLSTGASEFVEMFVGVGAARIRSLFTKARKLAFASGACILFIDEIDAIARARQFSAFGGGGETNTTQNQLLIEMDGLGGAKEDIVVIAATNSPLENLDPAIMRPGRFDRKIMINRPYVEGRKKLFDFYLGKIKYDPTIDTARLAFYTVGKSAADIESVVKEAAIITTREGRDTVTHKDMTKALERIDLGVKIERKIAEKEKVGTAYHEGGHALATYFLHPLNDVFKISIATRDKSLGVCHSQPLEEILGKDKEWYMANINTALGGYIAEKLKFGQTTSGVSGDFQSAMSIAYNIVWRFGMGQTAMVGDYGSTPPQHLDDATKQRLNADVDQLLKECLDKTTKLLETEHVLLDKLAEALLDKEDLEYDEIDALCQKYKKTETRVIEKHGVLQRYRKMMEEMDKDDASTDTDDNEKTNADS